MNITPELVERVARARYATIHDNDGMPWADQHASIRLMFREMSRVWLQAAADAGILTGYAYRAEYDSIPLGTYTTRAAAEQACEDDLTKAVDLDDTVLRWTPDNEETLGHLDQDTIARTVGAELYTHRPYESGEATGYTITAVPLLTAFDPTLES